MSLPVQKIEGTTAFDGLKTKKISINGVEFTGMVSSDVIADNAITSGKIASGAVTSSKIANYAITSGKIADGAVSKEKLVPGIIVGKLISGGLAGNHTVTGIAPGDSLISVLQFDISTGDVIDIADLTSEFTITAENTINNNNGTDTTGDKLYVLYQDLTE